MSSSAQQQRKNDLTQLVELIESNDANVADEATLILRDILNNGDTNCLTFLLDKYLVVDSERILDVICSVREPLDKLLLDKMCELLRQSSSKCLAIFAQLILKQPTWLYKLPSHAFFIQFLKYMRVCDNVAVLVGGVFCIASLLPLLPSMSSYLNEYFNVFLSLVDLLRIKSEWPEIYQVHLHIALVAFFQRLYALYPCNFLRFLRFHFAGANKQAPDKKILFESFIRPMLDHVKLHPLLIISSKDEEIDKERWMNKEAHDILRECNVIAVGSGDYSCYNDGVLRPPSSLSHKAYSTQSNSLANSQKTTPLKPINEKPINLQLAQVILPAKVNQTQRLSSKSSTLESGDLVSNSNEWSPSVAVGLSTPPSSRSNTPTNSNTSENQSSWLRSSRTNSFGVDVLRKKPAENKSRKSFGQALGRFFNKPDTSKAVKHSSSSSVPQSPMIKDTVNNRFNFPDVVPEYRRTSITSNRSDANMELAEEASETAEATFQTLQNVEALKLAEAVRKVCEEDSHVEDLEVRRLTDLSIDEGDSETACGKIRHLSSQSSKSRNLSRHSSFLEYPKSVADSNVIQCDIIGTTGENLIDENQQMINLPFFVGSPTAPVIDIQPKLPRLCNSQSVADFMKRVNRLRFHSQCPAAAPISPDAKGTVVGNFQSIAGWDGTEKASALNVIPVNLMSITRPRSCPVKMDETQAPMTPTPAKTPVFVCNSRRESNQPNGLPFNAVGQMQQLVFSSQSNNALDENSLTLNNSSVNRMVLDFPFVKMVNKIYESSTFENQNNEFVSVHKEYDGFEDFLLVSRLSHDYETIHHKNDKVMPPKMEVELLRNVVALLRHQLFYERHKRILHAERNRRLHGRLKQSVALEEQNQAQKDQMRLQEMEIQQFIQALSDARRNIVELKSDFVNKESVLTDRLQNVTKERDKCVTALDSKVRELSSVLEKNQSLLKELGACKQKLFDTTSQMGNLSVKNEKVSSALTPASDSLAREALVVTEINKKLRAKLIICREQESTISFLQTKLKDYETLTKKDTHDLKKAMKKERNRADASHNKVTELEIQVHKRQQQMGELKRLLEDAREIHQEHLKALQMKFRSLVSVCQRQEAHILELYQHLENVAAVNRETTNAFHKLSSSSAGGAGNKAGASKTASFTADDEGLRIPTRQGAKEIMSYESDIYGCGGSSCGSENIFLPFLFERRSAASRATTSVDEIEDEAVYAS